MVNNQHLRIRVETVAANAHLEPRLQVIGFDGGFHLKLNGWDVANLTRTTLGANTKQLAAAEQLLGLDPSYSSDPNTKWKIQTRSVNGWSDIKVSKDDGPYVDDHHETLKAAMEEMHCCGWTGDSNYRVVPASTPQGDDIY